MKKITNEFDSKVVDDFIESLQSKLPQYHIDVNNANDFETLLKEKENCHKCKGINDCKNEHRGFYTSFSDDNFLLVECNYKKELKKENLKDSLIKTLYLPKKILEADICDYYVNSESRKKIHASMINYITNYDRNNLNKGLYLFGNFSVGKTYTLACLANELEKNNISCLLIYFPDLVSDLKNAIGTSRYELLINMLKSVDVLMLDDLGSENMTPWLRDEVIGPIINYRLLEGKSIFISSNITPGDLVNHFAIDKAPQSKIKGERIVSRLKDLVTSICMDDCSVIRRG